MDSTAIAVVPRAEITQTDGEISAIIIASILEEAMKRRAETTVKAYEADVARLGLFIGIGNGPVSDVKESRVRAIAVLLPLLAGGPVAVSGLLERWRGSMEAEKLAPATVKRRLDGVLAVLSFFRKRHLINWTVRPDRLQAEENRDTSGPDMETVIALFASARDQIDERYVARDTALLWLLAGCGLRASEAAGLRIEDLVLDKGEIKIIRKGARITTDRSKRMTRFQIPDEAVQALRTWLVIRDKVHPQGKALPADQVFVRLDAAAAKTQEKAAAANAKPNAKQRVVFDGLSVYAIISRHSKHLISEGLISEDQAIHPHALRHFAITTAVEANADIHAASQFAGHSSIGMTMRYIDDRRTKIAVRATGNAVAARIAEATKTK